MRGRAVLPLAFLLSTATAVALGRQGSSISEAGLVGRRDILYFEDFETDSSGGAYTETPERVAFGRRSLAVMYKQGGHDAEGKPPKGPRLPEELDRIHIRRYVMFEPGFDFAAGGKIDGSICFAPGKRWAAGFGGKPSHGDDGFSCRLCWGSRGVMTMYTYHADMTGRYGSDFRGKSRFKPGVWQCVELMIKINTIDDGAARGNNDGEVRLWVDGKLDAERDGIRFRDLATMGIDEWSYGFYFGGTWTCPKDQFIYMDNVVLARDYIGPAVFERPKPGRRAEAKKIDMPERKKPKPGAIEHWDAKLLARASEELAAGRGVAFSVTAFQQRFEIRAVDGFGTLKLQSPVTEVDLDWSRLDLRDRRNLALALVREGEADDHCVAAFYLTATGSEREAREHLDKCPALAAEVEASFEIVARDAAVGTPAKPAEAERPTDRTPGSPRRLEATEEAPDASTDPKDSAAARLYLQAETAFIEGDTRRARKLFQRMLGHHPGSPLASKAKEYLEMLE